MTRRRRVWPTGASASLLIAYFGAGYLGLAGLATGMLMALMALLLVVGVLGRGIRDRLSPPLAANAVVAAWWVGMMLLTSEPEPSVDPRDGCDPSCGFGFGGLMILCLVVTLVPVAVGSAIGFGLRRSRRATR